MKFYICFEEYSEWNQFEGEWKKKFEQYGSLEDALKYRNAMLGSGHYRNVSKILKETDLNG